MSDHPSLSRLRQGIKLHFWRDRSVVWLGAVVTGLCVVGFVWITNSASAGFMQLRSALPWAPFLITPLGGMGIVWLTRRFASGAAGSGIPQVMAALHEDVPPNAISTFVSLRLSAAKVVLGAAAIAAGFSVGREGPSVQIAAGVMLSFYPLIKRQSFIKPRDLILAGGAAGIAAAFNTPLAGIMFAIEELSKRFEQRASGLLMTAIVIAGVVAVSLLGNLTYFGRIQIEEVPLDMFAPALLVTVLAGLAGGLFSRLVINLMGQRTWRISRWRSRNPVWFAGICGAVVAVLGMFSHGAAFGSGYDWSRDLLSGEGGVSPGFFAVKFAATIVSFWSGIAGGIFAPALAIGAGIGHDVAQLLGATPAPIIALGMVSFLAAVTQAPITSFIIVMEMTDGHAIVLSLMAATLLASMLSRLISAPLYSALAKQQLAQLTGS